MLIKDVFFVDATTSFPVEIAVAGVSGKLPLVVIVHGNFGVAPPFGRQLRNFTEEIASLGFVAALPVYYPGGAGNPFDSDIFGKVSILSAAIKHLSRRPDVDPARVGLVGFSLGGGISMAYINSASPGSVRAFVDFYGFVGPLLGGAGGGASGLPPTIVFHNVNDRVVTPSENSEPLIKALSLARVVHEPEGPPFDWYNESWGIGLNHAFRPGGHADVESRKRAGKWLLKYV